MHEMSIAAGIVEIVEREAKAKGAARVTRVMVDIGALSGVDAEAVSFCFSAAAGGTLAEGSMLIVNRIAGMARCGECGEEFVPRDPLVVCTRCQAFGAKILSGEELAVREMEVE